MICQWQIISVERPIREDLAGERGRKAPCFHIRHIRAAAP